MNTPTQPTPQPAGDAAIAQAFREAVKDANRHAEWWRIAPDIASRAIEIETARAIQDGKGAEYVILRPDGTHYLTDAGGANMASQREGYRVLVEAALAGSQGEVVGGNDRLLAALERAGRAESALRRLVDECDNDTVPGWEDRMAACIREANATLSPATTPAPAAPDGDGRHVSTLLRWARDCEDLDDPHSHIPGVFLSNTISGDFYDVLTSVANALSDQRVGEAVPYAWHVYDGTHRVVFKKEDVADEIELGNGVTPLYTAPPTAIPDGMVVDAEPLVIHGYTVEDHEDWFSSPADAAESLREYSDAEAGSEFYITPWHQLPKQTLRITGPETEDYEVIAAAPGSAEGDR